VNDTQTPSPNCKKRYELDFKRSAIEHWLASGTSAQVEPVIMHKSAAFEMFGNQAHLPFDVQIII